MSHFENFEMTQSAMTITTMPAFGEKKGKVGKQDRNFYSKAWQKIKELSSSSFSSCQALHTNSAVPEQITVEI